MGSAVTKIKSFKNEDKLTLKKIIEHNRKLSRNSLTPGPYKRSPRSPKKKFQTKRSSSRSPTTRSPTRSQTISISFGRRKSKQRKRSKSK